ncbi:MAG: mercuric reductase [Pirellulaceae bacterium]|nr:mercuric reductase [Pirellulaceae bacterium]
MSQFDQLEPFDEHNRRLLSQVHPEDWKNPTPKNQYHLVVIGAGTAGLVTAAGAAGLGAKVALIERDLMGGDCLNFGCVPSKALIASARQVATIRTASEFGIQVAEPTVDFSQVMQRMRRLRAAISPHDSAARFRDLGIDIFFGQGKFTSDSTIEVAGSTLNFKKAVIATGARAASLPIPGLSEAGYLTNESVFSLTELPKKIAVIGGGPIGCEMAQCFARFGSQVTLLETASSILPREEPTAARIVQESLQRDGVRLLLNTAVSQVTSQGPDKILHLTSAGQTEQIFVDQILLCAGRTPNVEDLGLDRAAVKADSKRGIVVDDFMRTTNRRIFAAGDVCSRFQFTHAADFLARIVIQNALFWGRARASKLIIPWCTYTSPEIAHVGLYPAEAERTGRPIRTFVQEFSRLDRAILDGETEGLIQIHCSPKSDRILGATIVGPHAGDLISSVVMAMKHNIGLRKIASVIHPYPTYAEALRKVGDQYNRTRLTPLTKWVLSWFVS